ncbi:MATE family efflux transporter [Paenibacillus lignilyticus]|uniref:MATE family efflux transporter n=1 Tax=Paenibacillus lignilyticus TaxID=1172615 RepID=A0ABS5CEK1_9BACL|nr:MATE family efflux transporter [Paenibacillus lignilyticus]MBP3964197.1 MATE family efflux transporter [Paenibacillus lignilyticus]
MAAQSTPRIWSLTWPIMIEMMLQFMLGTADTLMVSRISDDAVAVVGISNMFFNAVIILFTLVTSGAGILIAQKLGGGKPDEARQIGIMSVSITVILGIIISVLLIYGTSLFTTALHVPDNLKDLSHTYMSIVGGGMVITALNLSMSTAVRNTGNTRSPMYIALGMNILHVVLNYAFIFGAFGLPELGLMGVGISTVISRTAAFFFQQHLFRHAFGAPVLVREFGRFHAKLLKEVLKIGWPISVNGASWTFSQVVIFSIIASMGEQPLAARTYMNTMESFAFTFGWSLALAAQIQIAHLYGAKKLRQAYYSAYRALGFGVIVVLANTAVLLLFRTSIISTFTKDPWIIDMAVSLLWLNLALQPGKMLNMALGQSLGAVGDSRTVMTYSLPSMWIIAVGVSYVLAIPMHWGLYGIYIGMISDEYLRGALCYFRWRKHRKKLLFAAAFREDVKLSGRSNGNDAVPL